MTSDHPDPSRPDDSEPGLDIDAAFAAIVAHWEPSPPSTDDAVLEALREPLLEPLPDPLQDPLPESRAERAEVDDQPDDEEHFVPPPPPPLPKVEPRRKLAWIGLFGAPALALVLMVLGQAVPGWVELGLVAAFVGGFGYLVATMGSSPPDPWSGDDGAVL
jgi:hypothetical protein